MAKESEEYLLSFKDIMAIKNSPTDRLRAESFASSIIGIFANCNL